MSEEGFQQTYGSGRHSLEDPQEEQEEPAEDVQAESEDERTALKITRGRAFSGGVGGKSPWAPVAYEEPDLAEYFAQYEGLTEASQIAICRTFANYLAARARREPVKRRRRSLLHTYEEAQ